VSSEPGAGHNTRVDDKLGVVLDVEVTIGQTNDGEIIELQVGEVKATTGLDINTVTADSGYAYAKVYGALERRGIEALIPAKAEPVRSRVPFVGDDYPALLRARRRREQWSAEDRRIYQRHRWRSEGLHGEAKTWHGLARAVRRGLANMKIQAYLTAAAINLKRLAAVLFVLLRWIVSVAVFRVPALT
jgi:hypothetical protein